MPQVSPIIGESNNADNQDSSRPHRGPGHRESLFVRDDTCHIQDNVLPLVVSEHENSVSETGGTSATVPPRSVDGLTAARPQSPDELVPSGFEHFARTSSNVPGQVGYSLSNLPHILFQLDPGAQPDPPRRPQMVVDGRARVGPDNRNVLVVSALPDWISAFVDGWLMELWFRLVGRGMTYDYIISRMDENEVDAVLTISEAAKGNERKPRKPTLVDGDESNKKKNRPPWHTLPKGERIKGRPFHNTLNMRREHRARGPLGIRSWYFRRIEPTKMEMDLLDKLTEDQIKYNTTLNVTEKGLEMVRLDPVKDAVKKVPTGEYLPHDHFLHGAQPGQFRFSDRFQNCQKLLRELRKKAKDQNLEHWCELDKKDLPEGWPKKKKGNGDEDVAAEDSEGEIRAPNKRKRKGGPEGRKASSKRLNKKTKHTSDGEVSVSGVAASSNNDDRSVLEPNNDDQPLSEYDRDLRQEILDQVRSDLAAIRPGGVPLSAAEQA
jgi:hypothetical protein